MLRVFYSLYSNRNLKPFRPPMKKSIRSMNRRGLERRVSFGASRAQAASEAVRRRGRAPKGSIPRRPTQRHHWWVHRSLRGPFAPEQGELACSLVMRRLALILLQLFSPVLWAGTWDCTNNPLAQAVVGNGGSNSY